MTNDRSFAPWFQALTVLFIISNLVIFGFLTIADPTFTFDYLGEGLGSFPVRFLAARHVAMGFVLLYGFIRKNPTILTAMYATFLILSITDVILLALNPDYFLPFIGDQSTLLTLGIAIPMFTFPTALGLYHLISRFGRP